MTPREDRTAATDRAKYPKDCPNCGLWLTAESMDCPRCMTKLPHEQPAATPSPRREGDWITCPRCEGQKYDRGSCGLCGNLGVLDANGERFHCDCRANDWVEGDNGAIRCEQCGGYAGETGTSIRLVVADAS